MASLWDFVTGRVTAWARAAYVGWFGYPGYDRLPESADDLADLADVV